MTTVRVTGIPSNITQEQINELTAPYLGGAIVAQLVSPGTVQISGPDPAGVQQAAAAVAGAFGGVVTPG